MKKCNHLLIVAVTVLFLLPVVANASSLLGTKYSLAEQVGININGNARTVWTAEFQAQVRDEDGELVNGGEWFEGFCVELGQWAKTGTSDVEFVAPSLVDGGLHAAWIMENRNLYASDHAEWNNYEIAGLQLAIWEVTHNYSARLDYSLVSGAFKVTEASTQTRDLANFYLDSLATLFNPAGLDSKYKMSLDPQYQNFILNVPSSEPVPEPATMLLLGFGLLGLAGVKRKMKK